MIREKLKLLPLTSGCYLMKDKNNNVIYVGKAKNLKNRVSSYFNSVHNGKTELLVSEIVDFEFIITNTEVESLVLEHNLIKKYDPYYNILLKDDKTYPFVEISNDKYPRLSIVRNVNKKKDRTKLFGPYPNVTAAREVVNLLNRIYPLRKCINMPNKVCLYYHINECLGYCEKDVSKEETDKIKQEITRFLNGDHKVITDKIKEKLDNAVLNMNYESAIEYKNLLDYIEVTLNRQRVNLNDNINRDIFGFHYNESFLSIQVFFVRGGILQEREASIIPLIDEPIEQLTNYIAHFYEKDNIKPKEILVGSEVDDDLLREYLSINVAVPKKGDKKVLFDLACKNAEEALNQKTTIISNDEKRNIIATQNLANFLNIKSMRRVEIFDNSNLFGTYSVSGMVVFIDGKKAPSYYRKYKISIDMNDDYHMMKEVIYRRYFKALTDSLVLPDLIIVDGGKNQINAAKESLNELNLEIDVVGLKKDDKHTTNIVVKEDYSEVVLDKSSDEYLLLKRMQDEVHEYTINYHKKLRSKGSLASVLDNVPKIGTVSKNKLLKKYKTITKLKECSIEELNEVVNKDAAENLYNYLRNM